MPKMIEETIVINNLNKLTVRVKISTSFKIRGWIAKQLVFLAAWLIGANIDYEQVTKEQGEP